MDGDDFIERLNDAIRDRLLSEAEFDQPPAVEVFTERKSDFQNKIRVAIYSKLGFAVIVSTPEIASGATPYEIVANVAIHLHENVVINQGSTGSQRKCGSMAVIVYLALLNWAPDPEGTIKWSPMAAPEGRNPILVVAAPREDDPVLTYQVHLTTRTELETIPTSAVALSGTP